MCGLVGIVGEDLITPDQECFRNMLLMDYLRGEHSTGVFIESFHRETGDRRGTIAKAVGHPVNLFNRYPTIFDHSTNIVIPTAKEAFKLLLGHNRHATIGGQTPENAHPFRQGHIIGAHNGTVSTGRFNLKCPKEDLKSQTDSEEILNFLSRGGTLSELEETLTGAWALTWWDNNDLSLNIYRNNERELHYAFNEASKKLYWASEEWILQIASRKLAVKPEIKPVPIHTHIKFKLNAEGKFESLTEEKIEFKKSTTVVSRVTYPNQNNNRPAYLNNNSGNKPSDRPLPMPELEPFRERSFLRFKKTNDSKFHDLIAEGCSTCYASLEDQPEKVFFLSPNIPLCEDCSKEWKETANV